MENQSTEIMVIPFQVSPTEYAILIVLQQGNLDRIKEYDPAQIPIEDMPASVIKGLKLKDILIAYATKEECQQMMDDAKLGLSISKTLQMINRGWRVRPECGDDTQTKTILPPGRG